MGRSGSGYIRCLACLLQRLPEAATPDRKHESRPDIPGQGKGEVRPADRIHQHIQPLALGGSCRWGSHECQIHADQTTRESRANDRHDVSWIRTSGDNWIYDDAESVSTPGRDRRQVQFLTYVRIRVMNRKLLI